jgi:tyrosyl-tRNA synthetase
MAEELLEKIPPETRWAITAKILTRFLIATGSKTLGPLMSKSEGVLAPVMGYEKINEINEKIYRDIAKWFTPWVKEMLNIPVEDAIGAEKLLTVVARLQNGPEQEVETVEVTPERVVWRITKCAWWERFKELKINPGLKICETTCTVYNKEGLKAVNHKLTYKKTKAMPWGDPYCESVIEFKDE